MPKQTSMARNARTIPMLMAFRLWPLASFRCDAESGRHSGIADMAGLAGSPPPSRMTQSGRAALTQPRLYDPPCSEWSAFCEAVTCETHFYVSHSRTAASGRRARVSVWIDECSRLVGWTSVLECFGCVSKCGCRLLSGSAALAARSRYGVWRCWIGSGGFFFPEPPAFDRHCWRCLDGVLFLDDQPELVPGTQGVISSLVFTSAVGPELNNTRAAAMSAICGKPAAARSLG